VLSNRAEQLIGEIDGQITAMRPRLDVGAVSIAQMRASDTIAVYGWIAGRLGLCPAPARLCSLPRDAGGVR
jgi:hypothetical protein